MTHSLEGAPVYDICRSNQVNIDLVAEESSDTGLEEVWLTIQWEGKTYCLSLAGVETYNGWVKEDGSVISLNPDVFSQIEIVARDGDYL